MHRRLADLYENEGRFAANIDQYGEGLTTFLVAAIRENAAPRVIEVDFVLREGRFGRPPQPRRIC